MAQSTICMTAN